MRIQPGPIALLLRLLAIPVTFQACDHQSAPSAASSSPYVPPPRQLPAASSMTDASPASDSPDANPMDAAAPTEGRLRVHLVPVGVVSRDMLNQAANGLQEHAPVDPVIEHAQDFPSRSMSSERNRYRADVLLDWLGGLPIERTGKVMGITEADIAVKKGSVPNWGILGLGSLDGRCSIISSYRMKRKWDNGGAPDSLVRERLWKVAIHELGHTLGLEHCPVVGCIMEDGHGTVKTTDRDENLCAQCQARFMQALSRTVNARDKE